MNSTGNTPDEPDPYACSPVTQSSAGGLWSRLKMGRFTKNILSNAGGNALHSAMQLGLLLVLIRILDDHSYAAFLLATFLIGLLEMASDYGTRIWATREFSVTAVPHRILLRSIQSKAFYTVVSACIAAFMPLNTLDSVSFLICVLIASTQPSTDPLLWYLRGRERLDVEAGVVLTFRTLVTITMLICALQGLGLHVMLLVWLAGNIARLATEARFRITAPVFARPSSTDLKTLNGGTRTLPATLSYVFPIGTAFVLTALFQRATVFLLDIFATPQDVKFYGTAFKVVSTSGFVATSIFVSSFPRLAKAISADDTVAIRGVVKRMLSLVTIVFLPVCIFGILASIPLSQLVPLNDLSAIARVTVLLMPGLYLSCVNMGLKYTLNAFELNWQDVSAVLVGMVVLVSVTVFHGTFTWSEAAAIGWGAGEGSLLVCRLWLLWKHKRHAGIPCGLILSATVALIVMIGFTYSSSAEESIASRPGVSPSTVQAASSPPPLTN